jgi:hypothetical protein
VNLSGIHSKNRLSAIAEFGSPVSRFFLPQWARPVHICTSTGLTHATSISRLGSPRPILIRTGLTLSHSPTIIGSVESCVPCDCRIGNVLRSHVHTHAGRTCTQYRIRGAAERSAQPCALSELHT